MRPLFSSVGRHSFRVGGARTTARAARGIVSLVDFGADTVKAVVVQRVDGEVRVLGFGFASARECDLSGGRTAVSALAAAADEALVAAEDRAALVEGRRVVPDDAVFCVPARFVSGQFFTIRQSRVNVAKPISARDIKTAWQRLDRLVRDRLASPDEHGVTGKAMALIRSTAAVDGHPVTDPVGLKGRVISVSAFGVAAQPAVLRAIDAVAKRLEVTLLDVVAGPQSLVALVPQRDALVLDVGWQGTSLSFVRDNGLVATHWWPQGGDLFTRRLADVFRCSMERAEALKRAYVGHILSAADDLLVRRALVKPASSWFDSLIAGLTWLTDHGGRSLLTSSADETDNPGVQLSTDALPGRIYLTGGGSLLPELTAAARSVESASALPFSRAVEVESLGRSLGARLPNQTPCF